MSPTKREAIAVVAPSGGNGYFPPEGARQLVPSGCTLLDCALGGGWPIGRIVNIVGDKSTGKSLLAIESVLNFTKLYPSGSAYYVETEAAYDAAYAASLGLDPSALRLVSGIFTVEQLYADIISVISKTTPGGAPTLYIIDSLDALSDEAELASDFDAPTFGAKKAQRLSKFFRQVTKTISDRNFLLVIVSQIRDNIGVTFGRKYVRSGGHALDFYASVVLWLAHKKRLERQVSGITRAVGVAIKASLEKNKLAPPHRSVDFNILFGYGVDDRAANLDFLKLVKTPADPTISDEALCVLVKARWEEIEQSFRPTSSKY